MKHILKNHANLLTMSIMVAAIALAFLACEEKSKKADTPKTEKDCPYKEIGEPITAEAEFVSSGCAALDCGASFRLANGEEISLLLPDGISIVQDLIGTNNKASITYQRIQRLMNTYGPDNEDGGITVVQECYERDVLKSVEMKAKAEEEVSEPLPKTEAECPSKKIDSPITVEAVFLESACGEGCSTQFRLTNGEEIWLGGQADTLERGTKVSITYQKEQMWMNYDFIGQGQWCDQSNNLQSLTVLGK